MRFGRTAAASPETRVDHRPHRLAWQSRVTGRIVHQTVTRFGRAFSPSDAGPNCCSNAISEITASMAFLIATASARASSAKYCRATKRRVRPHSREPECSAVPVAVAPGDAVFVRPTIEIPWVGWTYFVSPQSFAFLKVMKSDRAARLAAQIRLPFPTEAKKPVRLNTRPPSFGALLVRQGAEALRSFVARKPNQPHNEV